jgi:glutathione S-transferase
MPTLYATYRSRGSRNLWLAGEMGIALDVEPVWQAYRLDDPRAPGAPLNTLSPSFLALSPMGAIPVLVDGDLVLSESQAINLHLARAHPDLGPRDDAERARMVQWALWGAASVEAPALAIRKRQDAGAGPDDTEVAAHAAALLRPLAALEGHLAATGQVVGARFTAADVNLAEIVRFAQGHAPLLDAHPRVDAWLRACQSRPAFRRMWAGREAEALRP